MLTFLQEKSLQDFVPILYVELLLNIWEASTMKLGSRRI